MNRIIFDINDGYREYDKTYDRVMTLYPGRIFSSTRITLLTEKTLAVGDHVFYKGYVTRVVERVYYPYGLDGIAEIDSFVFVCDSVYTGRRE